jgi:hypothetical protein
VAVQVSSRTTCRSLNSESYWQVTLAAAVSLGVLAGAVSLSLLGRHGSSPAGGRPSRKNRSLASTSVAPRRRAARARRSESVSGTPTSERQSSSRPTTGAAFCRSRAASRSAASSRTPDCRRTSRRPSAPGRPNQRPAPANLDQGLDRDAPRRPRHSCACARPRLRVGAQPGSTRPSRDRHALTRPAMPVRLRLGRTVLVRQAQRLGLLRVRCNPSATRRALHPLLLSRGHPSTEAARSRSWCGITGGGIRGRCVRAGRGAGPGATSRVRARPRAWFSAAA